MIATPDWLTKRGAEVKPGLNGAVLVAFAGSPQYRLDVRPAGGKFCCAVTQAVNAKRLDDATTYPTAAAAMAGGLEQLRAALGW